MTWREIESLLSDILYQRYGLLARRHRLNSKTVIDLEDIARDLEDRLKCTTP